MNYYARYFGDYGKKTAKLTLAAHGAYTLLLDDYYATEAPLDPEYDALYRICRAMTKDEQAAVRNVADKYFPIGADGLRHNERADEEIASARPRMEAARKNGKNGGRPAKNITHDEPTGLLNGNPVGYETETQQEPTGNPQDNQEPNLGGTHWQSSPTPIKSKASVSSLRSETGVPPPDPVKDLFDFGVEILTAVGEEDGKARALIGKLRKARNDPQAMAVLIEAKSKTDPKSYICAAINPKADKTGYVSGKGHTRVAL